MSLTLTQIEQALAPHYLQILGGFHPTPADAAPDGCNTLLMIGPDESGFWSHFQATPEYSDTQPNPMDRWSSRVLNGIADGIDARAVFPFGGPPWHPLVGWALRPGRTWASPVELLVHETAGLFVSFRGALVLDTLLDLPDPSQRPCDTCVGQPCRMACPVGALTPDGYDVPACRNFLSVGGACLTDGCAVRLACPIDAGRQAAQSKFHMKAFAR